MRSSLLASLVSQYESTGDRVIVRAAEVFIEIVIFIGEKSKLTVSHKPRSWSRRSPKAAQMDKTYLANTWFKSCKMLI